MPAVVLSPCVWLQIGLDGAQRPALRAMTPIRGIAYRAVFVVPVWQDRVNLSVASQHRLTQMQRLSAQPDHPNPVRRGCARPPRIYAVLARLASRRWPAPAFRRPCSLGGLVAYPPHSVWLHGHDAPEQRQLGTQEPDADCQVQCRLTLLPTRTRRRALPALHLQQRQRVSMG